MKLHNFDNCTIEQYTLVHERSFISLERSIYTVQMTHPAESVYA